MGEQAGIHRIERTPIGQCRQYTQREAMSYNNDILTGMAIRNVIGGSAMRCATSIADSPPGRGFERRRSGAL